MSVTLSEKFHSSIGGSMLRMFECTLAVDTNAITALSLDLNYIQASWISPIKQTLSAGSTSGMVLKYAAASTGITISGVAAAGDACIICAIGY